MKNELPERLSESTLIRIYLSGFVSGYSSALIGQDVCSVKESEMAALVLSNSMVNDEQGIALVRNEIMEILLGEDSGSHSIMIPIKLDDD